MFSQNVFPLQSPKSSMEMEGQSCHVAFYTEHTAAEDHWGGWDVRLTHPDSRQQGQGEPCWCPQAPYFLGKFIHRAPADQDLNNGPLESFFMEKAPAFILCSPSCPPANHSMTTEQPGSCRVGPRGLPWGGGSCLGLHEPPRNVSVGPRRL